MSTTARSSLVEQHIWRAYLLPEIHTTATMNTSNFFRLPRELQLEILKYMAPWEYVTFSLASYAQLRWTYPDYFPAVTRARLRSMRNRPSPGLQDPLQGLPNEMIDNIARHIEQRDLLRWVFAHYYTLSNSNPPLVPPLVQANATGLAGLFEAWLDEGGN
jgi:hypothetical protein